MPNERLRAALLERGVTPYALAEKIGVDQKTVERWIGGRTPYRRHRYAIATHLGVDEVMLWPDALTRDQVAIASESEVVAIYPHRNDVPNDAWARLFATAEHDIGVLVYSGLFLAENQNAQRVLAEKARAGVRVRILLGASDSEQVAERSVNEGAEGIVESKIHNVLVLYRPLRQVKGVEFRFHSTVLYNSIYLADSQLLVNTHIYGLPAAHAPVWHLRKIPGGEIAACYLESFEK